jgi:hypothetical protein
MTTKQEVEQMASELQSALNSEREFPCRNGKKGTNCAQQYEGKFDRRGRPVFFYNIDCTVVREFCDPCLAHWLAAVLRNVVLAEIRRDEVFAASAP